MGSWWVWWVLWVCVGDGWVVSGSVDSGSHKLSENVWFVWSKTSYSGEKWRCHRSGRTNKQQGKIELLSFWSVRSWVSQFNIAFCCLNLSDATPVRLNLWQGRGGQTISASFSTPDRRLWCIYRKMLCQIYVAKTPHELYKIRPFWTMFNKNCGFGTRWLPSVDWLQHCWIFEKLIVTVNISDATVTKLLTHSMQDLKRNNLETKKCNNFGFYCAFSNVS